MFSFPLICMLSTHMMVRHLYLCQCFCLTNLRKWLTWPTLGRFCSTAFCGLSKNDSLTGMTLRSGITIDFFLGGNPFGTANFPSSLMVRMLYWKTADRIMKINLNRKSKIWTCSLRVFSNSNAQLHSSVHNKLKSISRSSCNILLSSGSEISKWLNVIRKHNVMFSGSRFLRKENKFEFKMVFCPQIIYKIDVHFCVNQFHHVPFDDCLDHFVLTIIDDRGAIESEWNGFPFQVEIHPKATILLTIFYEFLVFIEKKK